MGVRVDGTLGQSSRPNECALYIDKYGFAKKEKGRDTNYDAKWKGADCKDGDRVMLTFNFVKKTCVVYYNGSVVGSLSENLPDQIYVAASLVGGRVTVETS